MKFSAVPAGLGSGVRFHPATLSDALVDHDADDVDRLLAIVEFDLLGGLDNRRWWFTIEVVRVVQVPVPHFADEVLRLWVSKVVTLVVTIVRPKPAFANEGGGMSKHWLG